MADQTLSIPPSILNSILQRLDEQKDYVRVANKDVRSIRVESIDYANLHFVVDVSADAKGVLVQLEIFPRNLDASKVHKPILRLNQLKDFDRIFSEWISTCKQVVKANKGIESLVVNSEIETEFEQSVYNHLNSMKPSEAYLQVLEIIGELDDRLSKIEAELGEEFAKNRALKEAKELVGMMIHQAQSGEGVDIKYYAKHLGKVGYKLAPFARQMMMKKLLDITTGGVYGKLLS